MTAAEKTEVGGTVTFIIQQLYNDCRGTLLLLFCQTYQSDLNSKVISRETRAAGHFRPTLLHAKLKTALQHRMFSLTYFFLLLFSEIKDDKLQLPSEAFLNPMTSCPLLFFSGGLLIRSCS